MLPDERIGSLMKQIFKIEFIRIALLLLAICLFGGLLSGCTNDPGTDAEGTTADTQSETFADGEIKIVENGVARYTLVYPENASKATQSAMKKFLDGIEEATGVKLTSKSDYIKRGLSYDSSTREILFGRTGYSETETVLETLTETQFAIRAVGNKIVITSPLDANLDAAVTYFCDSIIQNHLREGTDNMKTLCLGEYTSEATETVKGFQIDGVDLSEYQIVYAASPDGLSEAASYLQTYFREQFGMNLNCNSENNLTKTEHEILIGKTNRDCSQVLYDQTPKMLMSYRFVVENGTMSLVCGGAYSAKTAVADFMFQHGNEESVSVRAGTYLETNLLQVNLQELTSGASIRVMTSNILADRWVGTRTIYPSVPQRAEIYAAMLAVYQPDLVGVQESDMPWVESLPSYLDVLKNDYLLDYTWIENRYEELANLTSILYNSGRFEPVDHGTSEYGYVNHTAYKCRMLTWGVFRVKTDGQLIALMNTHSGATGAEQCTTYEIADTNKLIQTLTQTYDGIQIFSTGDFNNHISLVTTEEYEQLTGLIDSKTAATSNGTLVNEDAGIPEGVYIDHVYTSLPTSSVLRYETINVNCATTVSDHRFQYGDYIF